MTKRPVRVLVTYAWWRGAYVFLKSLSRKGFEVYAADYSPAAMCRFSRFKRKFIKIPSLIDKEEKFFEYISGIIKKYSIDIYIPVNIEVLTAAKYAGRFPAGLKLCIPEYENIRLAVNKKETFYLAEKLNIPSPETLIPDTPGELPYAARKMRFPVMLKCPDMQAAAGIVKVNRRDNLKKEYDRLIEIYKPGSGNLPLIQEWVRGERYGVSCLYDRGRPAAVFTHKRLAEQYPDGGPSVRRISVSFPELEGYALRILSALNWNGLAMVEFIYDGSSGKAYFLEINPRVWGSVNLPYISGADFPYMLCKTAMGERVEAEKKYKSGITSSWISGNISAFLGHTKKYGVKYEFFRKFLNFKSDGFDDFSAADPYVLFGEFLDYMTGVIYPRRNRLKYLEFLRKSGIKR